MPLVEYLSLFRDFISRRLKVFVLTMGFPTPRNVVQVRHHYGCNKKEEKEGERKKGNLTSGITQYVICFTASLLADANSQTRSGEGG